MKDRGRAEVRCLCPFCGKGRSGKLTASINRYKGLFHCFRCGEGHSAVSLYAKIHGIDTTEAYMELLDRA
jgi:DNA primase